MVIYKCLSAIVLSKLCFIYSPYLLRSTINSYKEKDTLLLVSLSSFFLLRYTGAFFNELKNVLIQKASFQPTVLFCNNVVNNRHLFTQPSIIINKKIERAKKAFKTRFTIKYTHVIPTMLDISFSSVLVSTQLGMSFTGVILSTVGVYIYSSIYLTNKRIYELKQLNHFENKMSHDIETVLQNKVNNEIFNDVLTKEIQLAQSLKTLNQTQQLILAVSNITLSYMWYLNPELNISDFVMMHLVTTQMYQPLNQIGMIYKEWVKYRIDLEELYK
jgi:ABC-type transport system involved in Fe-S cluster assembly fused permease/ATPase subunit